MLPFQWNSLRVGERVAVHDDADVDLGLVEGVVCIVQTHRPEVNEVGIRLDNGSAIVRPRRHAVHLLPVDGRPCWRCAAAADTAAGPAPGRTVAA